MKYRLIISSLIVFFFTFTLYFSTMPNINTGYADSDEMITGAYIWGVVHPPGYPLYTVISGSVGRLPIWGLTFAGKVNLVSVILHSFCAVFVFLSIFLLSKKFTQNEYLRLLLSYLGSLSLVVSASFWLYGTISEVFSLNNFFVTTLILISVIFFSRSETKKQSKHLDKLLLLGALVLGFGISNQQAVLMVYPAFVALIFLKDKAIFLNWKLLVCGIILFFIGFLAPYIYLPIAASHNPIINWENVHDINSLYRVITRRVFAESSPVQAAYFEPRFNLSYIPLGMKNFGEFIQNEFSYYFLALGILGGFYLIYKRAWSILIFLFLGVLGGGLFFANFSAFASSPDENYYLPHLGIYQRFMLIAPIFFSILIPFGVLGLVTIINIFVESFKANWKFDFTKISIILGLILLLLPAMTLIENYPNLKNNNYPAAHIYARALLTSLEKDAILLCFTEHSCFSGTYLQQVEGLRRDVIIVQVGFAQLPLDQFKATYPNLIKTVTPKTTLNHAVLIIRDIIRSNIANRPIYVAGINNNPDILSAHGLLGDPFFLVPQGCAMKVEKNFQVREFPTICESLNSELADAFYSPKNVITQKFPAYLSYQHYLNAYQYVNNGCPKKGREELAAALRLNPRLKAAKEGYLQITKSSDRDVCETFTSGPVVSELLVVASENEAKDSDAGLLNALYAMNQVVSLSPENIPYRLKLAELYMKSRAYNNALYEYSDVLERDPKNKTATKQVEYILNHNL